MSTRPARLGATQLRTGGVEQPGIWGTGCWESGPGRLGPRALGPGSARDWGRRATGALGEGVLGTGSGTLRARQLTVSGNTSSFILEADGIN